MLWPDSGKDSAFFPDNKVNVAALIVLNVETERHHAAHQLACSIDAATVNIVVFHHRLQHADGHLHLITFHFALTDSPFRVLRHQHKRRVLLLVAVGTIVVLYLATLEINPTRLPAM